MAVLAPDVVLEVDDTAIQVAQANRWGGAPGLARVTRGARSVADTFRGRARGASAALIDGSPGAVWMMGGHPRSAFLFTIEQDRITGIEIVMEPSRLAGLHIHVSSG